MRLVDADVLKAKQQKDADLFIGDDTLSGKSRRDEALNAVANIVNAPTVDIDAITESHERTGYDRGFRDGYAQATSEVRHGHWIERTKVHPDLLNESTYNYECSECGYWDQHGANVEVPYCWHCGAKMDEDRDYEHAVEQLEHDMTFEPTYNPEDGSM